MGLALVRETVEDTRYEEDPYVIAIVGAGPRGIGVLERLMANVNEILPGRRVRIEMVDPYPPGGGRVWRAEQSPLMLMNATAESVSMFADDTVVCEGPRQDGPSLSEWAATHGGFPQITDLTFADRATQGRYLSWVFDRIVAGGPDNVDVTVHAAAAVRLGEGPDGRQRLRLRGRPRPLDADAVVLALGHLDSEPDKDARLMSDFADRHGRCYVPRGYTSELDLSVLRAGEKVICRGFGLAFFDLMALLTEGRGGRFRRGFGDRLRYVPSGREPVLYVGSRRGVPLRSKFTYRLDGPVAPLPRFFDAAEVNARFADRESLDFRADLWPAMAKEIGWAYYHELLTAHPERATVPWPEFAAVYARHDWTDPRLHDHIRRCVPEEADRLDLETLDRPLAGREFAGQEERHRAVVEQIEADVGRRADPAHSADLAAFEAMLSIACQLPGVLRTGKVAARSHVEDVWGWWQSLFEYYGSGPPQLRSRQLLALAEAGVVRFLGPGMRITADEADGVFQAVDAGGDVIVEATALVETRLPEPSLSGTQDALLRGMYEDGSASELVFADDAGYHFNSGLMNVDATDFRVIDIGGRPHPRRFAIGPHTSERCFATFSRPRAKTSFRQNETLARTLLGALPPRTRTGARADADRPRNIEKGTPS